MKTILLTLLFISVLNATDMRALLFHGNCSTCHNELKSISAPSIMEVKTRYQSAFANKEDFVDYMATWVKNPNAETSLMSDAIKKYELMPQLGYDLATLKEVAAYIYETDFTKEHKGHKY